MQQVLGFYVILFLLGLALSTRTMAVEASPPLVLEGEVFADMSTLVAQMTRSQPIRAIGLSPDGHTLVTGDQEGTVRLWEVATGREWRRLHGHTGAVWVVRVNPDGQMVATGGQDGTVRLWDLVTGQERQRFEAAREHVRALDVSSDGTRLATGDDGGMVRVWDWSSGRELQRMAHSGSVSVVHWSPDNAMLVTSALSGIIQLWEVATGREMKHLSGPFTDTVAAVHVSPDGRLLTAVDRGGALVRWELASGAVLFSTEGAAYGPAVAVTRQSTCGTYAPARYVSAWRSPPASGECSSAGAATRLSPARGMGLCVGILGQRGNRPGWPASVNAPPGSSATTPTSGAGATMMARSSST
jgi:hypothetical protein